MVCGLKAINLILIKYLNWVYKCQESALQTVGK